MKKTACWLLILSMLLLLALPAGAAEKTPAFADAGDIRNGYAVRMLVDLGLIVGDNDGNFRPAAPITRAETAKLIACLCTDTFAQAGGAPFADTAESWARDYIAYCASRGIVGGSGGYFRPQDDVTAQELAKMLLVVTGSDGARYTGAGWSERVNADAEKYGLYHAFSGRYDLPVTRDDACLLIYNAMQRPAVDGENADGTPRYVLDALMNKRTYLEVRFDAVRYTAVLTGNEYADLTQAGGKLAAGTTKLEGHKEFSVSSGLWLVGHSVDLYLRDGEVIGAPAPSVQERVLTVFDHEKLERICAGNGVTLTPETRYYRNYSETDASVLDWLDAEDVVIVLDRNGNGWADAVLVLDCYEDVAEHASPLTLAGGGSAAAFSQADMPKAGERVRCFDLGGTTFVLPG